MRTPLKIVVGLAGLAALWTACWFAGRALWIAPEADRVVERLREGRLFVAYKEREIGGFPFGYEIRLRDVSLSDATGFWTWTASEARIGGGVGGGTGGGRIEIRPAPESRLAIEPKAWGGAAEEAPLALAVRAEAALVTLLFGPDGPRTAVSADRIEAARVAGGGPLSELRLALGGLAGESAFAGGEGAATMSAARLEAEWAVSPDGVREERGGTRMAAVELELSGAALDAAGVEEFNAREGRLSLLLRSGASDGTSGSTGGPTAAPVNAVFASKASETRLEVAGGRGRFATESEGLIWRIEGEGAPVPGFGAAAARASIELDAPLRRSPYPQDWSATIAIEEAAPAEALWAAFDPSSALGREPMRLRAGIGGAARVIADIGAPAGGQSPIDLETLELRDVRLEALGASAEAKGEVEIAGDAALPEGEVRIDLVGAEALLGRAEAAGLLPPAEAERLRAMAAELLRPGEGPDALVALIGFAADGAVTVNGQRVR